MNTYQYSQPQQVPQPQPQQQLQQQQQAFIDNYPPPFDYRLEPPRPRGRPPNSSKQNKNNNGEAPSPVRQRLKQEGSRPGPGKDKRKVIDIVGSNEYLPDRMPLIESKLEADMFSSPMIHCLCRGEVRSQRTYVCKCRKIVHAECEGS
jgi:hypothetical protein